MGKDLFTSGFQVIGEEKFQQFKMKEAVGTASCVLKHMKQ